MYVCSDLKWYARSVSRSLRSRRKTRDNNSGSALKMYFTDGSLDKLPPETGCGFSFYYDYYYDLYIYIIMVCEKRSRGCKYITSWSNFFDVFVTCARVWTSESIFIRLMSIILVSKQTIWRTFDYVVSNLSLTSKRTVMWNNNHIRNQFQDKNS